MWVKERRSVLDNGLTKNDEYFRQNAAEEYQLMNVSYDALAVCDTQKVFGFFDSENYKKSGYHDFIFCHNRSDNYYLHL
jgi:hypothetical protein